MRKELGSFAKLGHKLDSALSRLKGWIFPVESDSPPSFPDPPPPAQKYPEILIAPDYPAYLIKREFGQAVHAPVNIADEKALAAALEDAGHRSSETYDNPPRFEIDYETLKKIKDL